MWSAPVSTIAPLAEPVTLAAAKEFLSVAADETGFDALIAAFAAAAREQVEAMCGIRIMPQTVRLGASCWGDLARLPIGPVSAVAAIRYDDDAGTEQLLDPGVYELFGAGLERGIRTQVGERWPGGVRGGRDCVRVDLAVGYAAAPGPLWTAILRMTADLFAHRESVVVGTVAAKVPTSMQVEGLLANFRIWAL